MSDLLAGPMRILTGPMRLLDLFCGAGGAAMGYHRAGFDHIVGIDIEPQPYYPFEFIQADALSDDWGDFDLVHASPPCQAFTTMGNRHKSPRWPDLLAPTRDWLETNASHWVIENVSGARRVMRSPVELTGEMFGLRVHRPRLFELGGWYALTPPRPRRQVDAVAVYGKPDGRRLWDRADGSRLSAWASLEEGQAALGVPWIADPVQVAEAIPPAYTEWLGTQFLSWVAGVTE